MPRRKLARRFEPRYGVSQVMLNVESKYVGLELDDHLIQSTNDLKEKLAGWQKQIVSVEQELLAKFTALPDRQRVALRSMLARDCWHMAMLYLTFLGSSVIHDVDQLQAATAKSVTPNELSDKGETLSAIPFKETLFG